MTRIPNTKAGQTASGASVPPADSRGDNRVVAEGVDAATKSVADHAISSDQLRALLVRERHRNRLDDIEDHHLAAGMRKAARVLAEFEQDHCFRYLLRILLARFDGRVPKNLRARYLAAKASSEFRWLEGHVEITGDLPEQAVPAIGQLAIAIHQQRARLEALAWGVNR